MTSVGSGAAAPASVVSSSITSCTSATAATQLRAVGSLPGTYSSSTACKFVPPKPNALTPARRTSPAGRSHSRSSVFTRNGEWAKSMSGFGAWKLIDGGSTPSDSASTVFRRPAPPAAAFRWPMFDFTEPRAIDPGASEGSPKPSARLATSTTSPTFVEVPWPSTRVAVAGSRPALRQARSTASRCPIGFGAVMPLPRPSLEPAIPRITA